MHKPWFSTAIGDERALLKQASELLATYTVDCPQQMVELLTELNATHGTNVATAAYYQHLVSDAIHGNFIANVRSKPDTMSASETLPHIIIVPGMFATEKPELGGDGALLKEIAANQGFSVSTAPTDGRASLAHNAQSLHNYLCERSDKNYWLVSVSRGSSDVKCLLHQYPDAPYQAGLNQWISISGIVSGSPLVNRLSNQRINSFLLSSLARLRGMSPELPGEFDCSREHWSNTRHNNTFGITHVAPIPLDWHVTNAVLPRYKRLKAMGPTDGIFMLTDLLTQPGRIYPIWGADHMLRVPNLADHFYQLINFLKDEK